MAKTRMVAQVRPAVGPQHWNDLATKVLGSTKDTRIQNMVRTAISAGQLASVLKRLGIVCDADVERLFGSNSDK